MAEKYLIFSLDDAKSKKLGDVISNNSSKKIINFLADSSYLGGVSAGDISTGIGIPLNSLDYNLKKLIEAGLVEKIKGFFWSSKGRKIERYKIVNKLIVISPGKGNVYSKLKGIVPIVIISTILTGIVAMYYNTSEIVQESASSVAKSFVSDENTLMAAVPQMTDSINMVIQKPSILSYSAPWVWFAGGAVIVIALFTLWNWKKL